MNKVFLFFSMITSIASYAQKEDIEMDIHLLGQLIKIKEINEFTEYRKM